MGHDKKKVLWEVVGDHVVEDPGGGGTPDVYDSCDTGG